MISKLPRWVLAGSFALSFVAGTINVIGLLGFDRQAVTHVTGSLSQLGTYPVVRNGEVAVHLVAVVASFFAGTVLCSVIVRHQSLKLGRSYGLALLLESLLLCAAAPLLEIEYSLGNFLMCAAAGLQNAMATTYSGAIVRTTHMTGAITDLGILVGHLLRRHPVNPRRLKLCLLIISGFFAGSVAGALAFGAFGYGAIYLPAAVTGLAGLAYNGFRHWRQRA